MRQQYNIMFPNFFQDDDNKVPSNARAYREKYQKIDALLKKYPELLQAAHRDLQSLSKPDPTQKRKATFTTENLFRAVLVKTIENVDYRRAEILICENKTFQDFCRLYKKETINHSLLCTTFKALSPETWKTINHCLALRMKQEKKIDLDNIRTDTTVVETNIHYPTDSSLLWDTYRTIDRLWTKALDSGLGFILPDFRFHSEKVRKLYLDITRFSNSKSSQRKRLVKNNYKI
jgi:IS5 family transposase